MPETKSLGEAIDAIVEALSALPEGTRMTAIRAACEHLGLALPTATTTGGFQAPLGGVPIIDGAGGAGTAPSVTPGQVDIRSFKDQKMPGNGQEMACVMAYYLQSLAPQAERKSVVTPSDVVKYFPQAGYPLPKVPGQVLVDAKAAGYFDAPSRGSYKLNPVGHNLVVHSLPRLGGGGPAAAKARPTKRTAKGTARKR